MITAPASPAWRLALAQRLRGWDRDAFVPLRVALSSEEQQLHASAAPSLLAGYVRKDCLEVRSPVWCMSEWRLDADVDGDVVRVAAAARVR